MILDLGRLIEDPYTASRHKNIDLHKQALLCSRYQEVKKKKNFTGLFQESCLWFVFAPLLYFAAKSFENQSRTAAVSSIYCTLLRGNEKKKSILLLQEAVKLPRFSTLDRKTTHTVSF